MKGSTVAGVGLKNMGGAGKGTTKPNAGTKPAGIKKIVAPNQKLATKTYKTKAMGTVQGIRDSIHKSRGGSTMKKVLGGRY